MSAKLQTQIEAAATMTELEDLYLPYRPKRRTRATIAKEIEAIAIGNGTAGRETEAFVRSLDLGVHQDGLAHISQLADRYIKDPNEVVKVRQKVQVKVLDVDLDRKRIALTMRL